MSLDDLYYEIYEDIRNKSLQKEFDEQLKKMSHQDKWKHKEVRDKWQYAYDKVLRTNKNKWK